jgi:hypothetical protein
MSRAFLIPCLVPALFGCAVDHAAARHRGAEPASARSCSRRAAPRPRVEAAPASSTVSQSLLPPLRATPPRASSRQLEQRFDLKVSDAPIGQVLLAIVQDTPYSVLLSPRACRRRHRWRPARRRCRPARRRL